MDIYIALVWALQENFWGRMPRSSEDIQMVEVARKVRASNRVVFTTSQTQTTLSYRERMFGVVISPPTQD